MLESLHGNLIILGDRGFPGEKGAVGPFPNIDPNMRIKGEKGESGDDGRPGLPGLPGVKGDRGFQGRSLLLQPQGDS